MSVHHKSNGSPGIMPSAIACGGLPDDAVVGERWRRGRQQGALGAEAADGAAASGRLGTPMNASGPEMPRV